MISLLLALASVLAQDDDRGPFDAHGSTIYQLASTDFIPNMPRSLKAGEFELRTDADWTNCFTESPSVNYYDSFHSRTSLWFGLDGKMTVGLSESVLVVGGGFMDPFINRFHDAFGIKSNRVNYPENKFLVQSSEHAPVMELPSRCIAGDMMLTLHYKILEQDGFGLFVGSQWQLPTGGKTFYYEHRGLGVGTYLYSYVDVCEDLRIFAAGDYAYIGRGEVLWHKLRPFQASALAGVDFKITTWLSIVVQVTTTSGAADWEAFSSWASEAEAGFRFKLSNRVTFEFGATEHLIRYDNNADFGVHTGLALRF